MSLVLDCNDAAARAGALRTAADSIGAGELVVLPTDTVYGIAADAFDHAAVASLLAAKGRGPEMPVPVLVGSWSTIDGLVSFVTDTTRALIEAFWPGGLTLVVQCAPSLSWNLGDTDGTVAIRMPLHPVAIELLELTGPLAVSSANRTGHSAALTATEAQRQLGESVAVYLDGGAATEGVASTIVDLTGEAPRILRRGAIAVDALREIVPTIVDPTAGRGEG